MLCGINESNPKIDFPSVSINYFICILNKEFCWVMVCCFADIGPDMCYSCTVSKFLFGMIRWNRSNVVSVYTLLSGSCFCDARVVGPLKKYTCICIYKYIMQYYNTFLYLGWKTILF
jgi:hypothetical protein